MRAWPLSDAGAVVIQGAPVALIAQVEIDGGQYLARTHRIVPDCLGRARDAISAVRIAGAPQDRCRRRSRSRARGINRREWNSLCPVRIEVIDRISLSVPVEV